MSKVMTANDLLKVIDLLEFNDTDLIVIIDGQECIYDIKSIFTKSDYVLVDGDTVICLKNACKVLIDKDSPLYIEHTCHYDDGFDSFELKTICFEKNVSFDDNNEIEFGSTLVINIENQ